LESHGNSSNTDISIHVATFDNLGIDIAYIESSDTDRKCLISSACQIFPFKVGDRKEGGAPERESRREPEMGIERWAQAWQL
jgi:hypothetical protein